MPEHWQSTTVVLLPFSEKKLGKKIGLNEIGRDLACISHLGGQGRRNSLRFSQYVWPTFSFS
jgi:hypothetical protein